MSESGDYDPGPWKGYDFKSARRSYDVHVGRSYDDAVSSGKKKNEILEKSVTTNSEYPVVIACDVTGSMGEWPATIFSKLPYLDLEGKEYLGKTMEISFAAVGDAYCDQYPLQVRPFTSGTDMKKRLEELVIEKGGGGQIMESYDLAAVYYANNAKMSKAIHKPIFIFIGDEGLYESVDKDQAKDCALVSIEGRMSAKKALENLKEKFSVYLIRKPYENSSGDGMSGVDKKIYNQWESYLGADHIAILPEAGRVVDVIFGIFAKETDRVDYFKEEIEGRQKPNQIAAAYKSLRSIHNLPPKNSIKKIGDGRSVMRRHDKVEDAKSLI